MNKKFNIYLISNALLVIIIVFLCGCSSQISSSDSSGDNGTGDGDTKTTYDIYLDVYPTASVDNGNLISYHIGCYIYTNDVWIRDDEFKTAEIIVNGINLTFDNFFKKFEYIDGALSLKVGDPVTASFSHPLIGTFTLSTTVPTSVTSFTINPALPAIPTPNTEDLYTISWIPNSSPKYMVWVDGSFTDNKMAWYGGYGQIVSTNTYTFPTDHLKEAGTIFSYIQFTLNTINEYKIEDSNSTLILRVCGTYQPTKTNSSDPPDPEIF